MLDFLSEKTRVPFVHTSILFSVLTFLAFLFWNVFVTAPAVFLTTFSFFWFFLAFLFGIFSQSSSSAFPYLFTFLPTIRERDRFVPMRAVAYTLTTVAVALCFGVGIPVASTQIIDFLSQFIVNDTLFVAICFTAILFAYGAGLYWSGLISPSSHVRSEVRIPYIHRYKKIFSDVVYSGFSFMIDVVPFLWLPLLSIVLRGDILYGMYILFAFAAGRVIPILILSLYSSFHIDISPWILKKRETIRFVIAGTYILVAVFLLSLSSQLFTQFLPFFREHGYVVRVITDSVLPVLLILPLWLYFFAEFRRVFGTVNKQLSGVRARINTLVRIKDRMYAHCLSSVEHAHSCLPRIEKDLEQLEYQARVLSSAVRHRLNTPLRAGHIQKKEEQILWKLLVQVSGVSLSIISFYYIFL